MESRNKFQDAGQVSIEAAKVYEEFFVPAIFEEWSDKISNAAQIKPGNTVLDVACGTGVLTRYIDEIIKPSGKVIGLDMNEAMLTVAKERNPEIEWKKGNAESLEFKDESFDVVVCQFGLMFFFEPAKALKEMLRVLKVNGYLVVSVWDKLEKTPGYASLLSIVQEVLGDEISEKLRTRFRLGEIEELLVLFKEAGINSPLITTMHGTVNFPSIRDWIFTEIRGWTSSDLIDDEDLKKLISQAEPELKDYEIRDRRVVFNMPAHIITITKLNQSPSP